MVVVVVGVVVAGVLVAVLGDVVVAGRVVVGSRVVVVLRVIVVAVPREAVRVEEVVVAGLVAATFGSVPQAPATSASPTSITRHRIATVLSRFTQDLPISICALTNTQRVSVCRVGSRSLKRDTPRSHQAHQTSVE